jgi:hypothetical protein
MRRTVLPLFLAAACLLLAAPSRADAQLYRSYYGYYGPRPVYPGVHFYPQVVTSPYYGFRYPPLYYPNYYPTWSAAYGYFPAAQGYSFTPWGSGYYYTNPSYYFWYRMW